MVDALRRFAYVDMDEHDCIRCGEAPIIDELGYCGHCHWAVRAEIEDGLARMRDYLRCWARFEAWCAAHGRSPHAGIA